MEDFTTDTFFNGRIRVKQYRYGYRFSIDAVLLAYHARLRYGDRVVDLGTGCCIIPLILVYRYPGIKVYGVEIQEELAHLAAFNVQDNRMDNRISVLCEDLKTLNPEITSGPVDVVVSNPPYRRAQSGRVNPDQQRAIARHEIKVTLYDIVETSRRLLHTAGRFITIYPAERTTDILMQMRSTRIEPKFLRMIHSRPSTDAKLVLVEGIKGGQPGTKIAPPLTIYQEDGSYTDEVKKMFRP
jgi:tRNA1Val (adenine37-N6)-methyltransferase